jgi:hypothetical protein
MGQGPQGPAMTTAIDEALTMPEDYLTIINRFRPDLANSVQVLKSWVREGNLKDIPLQKTKKEPITRFLHGKLSWIPDKEGKTRVIALTNY